MNYNCCTLRPCLSPFWSFLAGGRNNMIIMCKTITMFTLFLILVWVWENNNGSGSVGNSRINTSPLPLLHFYTVEGWAVFCS